MTAGTPGEGAFRSAAATHQLDWARIAAYLQRHGITIDPETEPRQFAGGLANLNYLLRTGEGWTVLRRPPPGPLPPGAHDMRREHRILSRLWQELPLAPRSLHLCEDGDVAGAPFQLLEYRSGVAVRGDSLAPLPETAGSGAMLSGLLIETLAAVHAVDVDAVGLGGLGNPENFFRRNCAGWARRAELILGAESGTAVAEIVDWLAGAPDLASQAPTLLHSDFKLDNILLDPATYRPVAILDWDMGTRGNPLLDLATLLSYWTEPGDPPCMQRLAQMPTSRPGFLSREAAAARYGALTGRSLDGFKSYRVLAVFKLGVVFHQLDRIHSAKPEAERRGADFGALAGELLDFCRDIIRDKIF